MSEKINQWKSLRKDVENKKNLVTDDKETKLNFGDSKNKTEWKHTSNQS